ncbi:hypothetical protein BOTBODRAFT_49754 [Botryobasidium botryosum FD-172 SS1]|uniref:Uncharacterized protein n=1 Tax=Botryobasidium botryosum (strain FD-172 SS1) TaxID=930990 RepID=A0A067LTV6_BOTB1|nr:hypothetical protein BOTBODRAFT_49754 [Botryobasidium botryosum FD-172 SS1]
MIRGEATTEAYELRYSRPRHRLWGFDHPKCRAPTCAGRIFGMDGSLHKKDKQQAKFRCHCCVAPATDWVQCPEWVMRADCAQYAYYWSYPLSSAQKTQISDLGLPRHQSDDQ